MGFVLESIYSSGVSTAGFSINFCMLKIVSIESSECMWDELDEKMEKKGNQIPVGKRSRGH